MPMHSDGLTKLMEECGELIQIAAKKSAFPDSEIHPDGKSINIRLQEEIADVVAAISLVVAVFDLDRKFIDDRANTKAQLFFEWQSDPTS